jgi:uncharacterized membrane protein
VGDAVSAPERTPRAQPLTREQVDVLLGNVLRYGVILCAVIITFGVALGAVQGVRAGSSLGEVLPHLLRA